VNPEATNVLTAACEDDDEHVTIVLEPWLPPQAPPEGEKCGEAGDQGAQ
jgi:hypothetical protein